MQKLSEKEQGLPNKDFRQHWFKSVSGPESKLQVVDCHLGSFILIDEIFLLWLCIFYNFRIIWWWLLFMYRSQCVCINALSFLFYLSFAAFFFSVCLVFWDLNMIVLAGLGLCVAPTGLKFVVSCISFPSASVRKTSLYPADALF